MVAIVSGGMDSVTLAHILKAEGWEGTLLSVDYGQRHSRELQFAHAAASDLGLEWRTADLTGITHLISSSALTDPDRDVPEGHYAEPSMMQTVVPNRNMILLSVAIGLAVDEGAGYVFTGVHAGDHPIYPDCRPEFIEALSVCSMLGTMGFGGVRVRAPFAEMSKAEIALAGAHLGVDFAKTWSCYQGGEIHCGRCSTCVERLEALDHVERELGGFVDPTIYADGTYWRSVV